MVAPIDLATWEAEKEGWLEPRTWSPLSYDRASVLQPGQKWDLILKKKKKKYKINFMKESYY